nr:hypothetical protein [Acholeplasmatales bacterium]
EYNAYVKETDGTYTKLDSQLIRKYKTEDGNNTYYRVDAVGLAAGTYTLKIAPVFDGTEADTAATEIANLAVVAYDRTGFAWKNGTSSGAYNENGTLKSNALVIYITNSNQNSISVEITGAETSPCVGILQIMEGLAKGKETRPVDIRIIGNVGDADGIDSNNTFKGDWCISNKNTTTGITVEGIGEDATANGWGLRVKNASNVEIRNLGFMNCDSYEGDSIGLQQGNDHCWVHDNDLFYGNPGGDEDQAKGDGALDIKKTQYATLSYNHYWDCGKSTLHSNGDDVEYVTYHHNWFDHSDSRHPRIRISSCVHIYNNFYDGNSKYGVGVTSGSSAFVENNYFRNCKNPMLSSLQGTDALGDSTFSREAGGMIKAFNNTIIWEDSMADYSDNLIYANATQGNNAANATSFDAYLASSRDEVVPSTYTTYSGGTTYSNFDTDSSIMYSYTAETPEAAKATVEKYAGRVNNGDFQWTFDDSADDTSYAVNTGLKSALTSYTSNLLSVQGIGDESSGSGDSGSTTEEVTVDSVIALIDALPEASAITESDRENVNAAKAAYDSLSETDQASVTNYSKLEACIAALAELAAEAQVLVFGTTYNTYFTVSGNESTSKGTVTYNGTTYSTCLKMESSTSITFTSTTETTLILVMGTTGANNIIVDDTTYTGDSNYVITVTISAGTHTITKKDSANLFYVSVE